ncbi:MAG TPA: D-alanyl-D-alanine carboxypeptidase [Clostridiales bacterium]|nr:D-alanyl-D-alanine carboxypeptidase [Clostridiales bacterium]
MMKKFLLLLLPLALMVGMAFPVFADGETEMKVTAGGADFTVDAKSAVLMEASTGKILFSQNESAAYSPASVTKIMTLLLVMEAVDSGRASLDDKISVSEHAASMGGSQVFLKEGEVMTLEDLLKCTVIASANDAALALAEHICGSESAFVSRMNSRAGELGMKSSHFENVTGLDDTTENHVTSALDIALMSRELLKHETILKYSSLWQDSIRDGAFVLTNTNRLVRYYEGCNGLKTGSTAKAGYCVSATAKRGNMQLIAVVMGAESRDVRNAVARSLLDYGFGNFALYENPEAKLEEVPVLGGTKDSVTAMNRAFSAVIDKSHAGSVEKSYEIPENLKAPVEEGGVIGKIVYRVGDEIVGESEIYAAEGVSEITFGEIFLRLIKNILIGE